MELYDHYIGLDWAQQNMAIARMTKSSNEAQVLDVRSDIGMLQEYLINLKGRKILTFEESNPAQWLFTELRPFVDEIIVCDPYRNHLMKEGAKNDRIDAKKLVHLLKSEHIKPVFHRSDEFIKIRKLISGYEDLVKLGVQQKNQRKAMFRACGKSAKKEVKLDSYFEQFVLEGLDQGILRYEEQKKKYEAELKKLVKENKMIANLQSIPGLGPVNSALIAAMVVDPARFDCKQKFWSYCGLIRHQKMSGGRSYGQRSPRCSRRMRTAFKTAAMSCIANSNEKNPFFEYYQKLIIEKRYPEHQARHAVARRIATLALGVMKTGTKFKEKDLFEKKMT
jgi:transposase